MKELGLHSVAPRRRSSLILVAVGTKYLWPVTESDLLYLLVVTVVRELYLINDKAIFKTLLNNLGTPKRIG
jgi:hypothetical protein